MHRWTGRTALVTGSASGIGRATTVELLRLGVNVVACDLSHAMPQVEAIRKEVTDSGCGRLMAVACDVSSEEDVVAAFEKVRQSDFKGVDICVNSAGICDSKKLSAGDAAVWKKMLEVNVFGLSVCTREALKSMKERRVGDGHIIHLCSISGHKVLPRIPFYSATKFAVRALTEGLRQELAEEKSGIRVTAISPDPVNTPLIHNLEGDFVKAYLDKFQALTTADIVASIIHALSAPKHVQVHDIIIKAVAIPPKL